MRPGTFTPKKPLPAGSMGGPACREASTAPHELQREVWPPARGPEPGTTVHRQSSTPAARPGAQLVDGLQCDPCRDLLLLCWKVGSSSLPTGHKSH